MRARRPCPRRITFAHPVAGGGVHRCPQFQGAAPLGVLAEPLAHEFGEFLAVAGGEPLVQQGGGALGRYAGWLCAGEQGEADGDAVFAEVALLPVRAVARAVRPVFATEPKGHLVHIHAGHQSRHGAVIVRAQPGHGVQVALPTGVGARPGASWISCSLVSAVVWYCCYRLAG